MTALRYFRDTALWTQPGGEPEYPGHVPDGPRETIPVRDAGSTMVEIGGDTVQRKVYWTLPEHAVAVGHTLDGHRVTELAGEVKDLAGTLSHRVWYAAL
jgi:hypothetical protein